jgi:hypothetical protein
LKSAVIVKDSIWHNEEVNIQAEDFQATVLNIKTKITTLLWLVCIVLRSITSNRFIIGGDFNAKHTHWGSRLITPKGRELLKAINVYKCEAISTGKPTYWPTDPGKIPDLIDFYITKNISSNYI